MAIELQKIDCNCNNCIFMIRDLNKHKESQASHHKWQLDYFNTCRQKIIDKANYWRYEKGDLEKWNDLKIEADKMKFQFNKSTAMINFGFCSKFNKDVRFIPNTIQLDTQECFKHRSDEN